MKLNVKNGVSIGGIKSETIFGILVAATLFDSYGAPFVLTSVMDGKHMNASLHYGGFAFDCRLPSRYVVSGTLDAEVVEALAHALGAQWDVVLEKDHIHVEFDPDFKETTNG